LTRDRRVGAEHGPCRVGANDRVRRGLAANDVDEGLARRAEADFSAHARIIAPWARPSARRRGVVTRDVFEIGALFAFGYCIRGAASEVGA